MINMTMTVTLTLQGKLEMVVRKMMEEGYATSKAEVLRMGLIRLEEEKTKTDGELKHFSKVSEKHLKKIWDTPKEEAFWSKYY